MGFEMVMPLLLLKNIRNDSLKDKSLINMSSFFKNTARKWIPSGCKPPY
jgi:hypothetical protein